MAMDRGAALAGPLRVAAGLRVLHNRPLSWVPRGYGSGGAAPMGAPGFRCTVLGDSAHRAAIGRDGLRRAIRGPEPCFVREAYQGSDLVTSVIVRMGWCWAPAGREQPGWVDVTAESTLQVTSKEWQA